MASKPALSLKGAPTPQSRTVRLIREALTKVDPTHPAHKPLLEALESAEGLDPYIEALSTPIIVPKAHPVAKEEVHKVYADLLTATEEADWKGLYESGKTQYELHAGMMTFKSAGAYEAAVLQHLASDAATQNILEIGLFTGTTSLALALLPNIKTVTCLDIESYLEEFDRPFWKKAGVSEKITTIFAPAADTLKSLKAKGQMPFDLCFIDANKPDYRTYVELLLDLDLLSPHGVILADNTLYKGYVYAQSDNPVSPSANIKSNNKSHSEATQGIIDFNRFVRDDPRLEVVILPIRDGISVIRRTL